jgi:hypothetical protein
MLERLCYALAMEKHKKTPRDLNKLAAFILDEATNEVTENEEVNIGKNPAAVALGRLGGLKGGKARAESLSAKRRKEIAKNAAAKRWGK